MPGRKTRADSAATEGWGRYMNRHSTLCTCGHPEWRHRGLNEPACTYLGLCPCLAFQSELRSTA